MSDQIPMFDGTPCIIWPGAKDQGYGRIKIKGRKLMAHRVIYENIKGKIKRGLELDHLCRNRGCVNPDHLEPVTTKENVLRGNGACARNARKTHCKNGHALVPGNIVKRHDHPSSRECLICHRANGRNTYRRKNAACR